MIKDFLTDTLEINTFLDADNRDVIRDYRIKRYKQAFNNHILGKKQFFGKVIRPEKKSSEFSSLDKIRIVVESLIKESDIDSICANERISKETYYSWKEDFLIAFKRYSEGVLLKERISSNNKKLILKDKGTEVYEFFKRHIDELGTSKNLVIPQDEKLTTYSNFYSVQNVFILNKMNNFRKINKHLEEVNQKLPINGVLLGCFETFRAKHQKNKLYKIPIIKNIYFGFEFIFKRVFPKLPYFKKAYFFITKGKNRLLSKAEALGRLVSCGFEIMDCQVIDGVNYFAVKKIAQPSYNMNPSYGPLFKMNRVGKNGKIIGVYKFRTMHPYSEYLQDYILKLNGYAESGKPANDFRLVPWGKFLRRYWLDELPQLINVIKGELKLVGIRPVSQTYFKDIPLDIQELRLTQKPGCIPPYVALNRKSSVNSVLQAEKEYLVEKIKNPFFTDTKYFFRALYNIVFKRKRSA